MHALSATSHASDNVSAVRGSAALQGHCLPIAAGAAGQGGIWDGLRDEGVFEIMDSTQD